MDFKNPQQVKQSEIHSKMAALNSTILLMY